MSFMPALFYFSIFMPLSYFSFTKGRAIDSTVIAGCPNKCGDVEISYPFGIGEPRCFFKGFEVVCIQNIPYLTELNLQLFKIMQGEVSISLRSFITTTCQPPAHDGSNHSLIQLPETSPFTISLASNKFIAIACSTVVTVSDNYTSSEGCSSGCPTKGSVVNGSCEGHGCCAAPLPQVKKMMWATRSHHNSSISHCSYGFFIEDGSL